MGLTELNKLCHIQAGGGEEVFLFHKRLLMTLVIYVLIEIRKSAQIYAQIIRDSDWAVFSADNNWNSRGQKYPF